MNTSTVILRFGNEKHCFLLLIDNSGLRVNRSSNTASSGIIVYETDLPSGQKAYFTVLGNSVELNSGDIVELNKEYGIRLGFKDDFESPLPLKAIGHVSSAKRVFVEPLTANDWEIIKSQSIKVESLILNQVRVVWPGQLLPLWLMKNVSISLKINSVEPLTPCALLEQNTEIVINPKNRIISPPSSLGLQRQQSGPNLNTRHWVSLDKGLDTLEPKPLHSPVKNVSSSRRDHHRQRNISNPEHNLVSRQTSVINWMSSRLRSGPSNAFLWSLFQAPVVSKKNSPDAGSGIDFSMGKQPSRSGVLRVQPMKIKYTLDQSFPIDKSAINKQITSRGGFKIEEKVDPNFSSENHFNVPYEIFQPSTVYVDAESAKYERQLHPYLPYLPNNFIARLKKLPAPNEKTAKSIKNVPPTTNGGQGDTSEINNSSVDSSNFSDCCYVRVVAIDRKAGLTDHVWRNAADEVLSQQPLLFGHVIIPDMLRCQLNLKATSSVWLKTGPFEPIIPKKVCIYPVKSTIPAGSNTDSLKASFIHYINQCADENHPLVVFQGLFLKFMTFKGHPVEAQLTFFGDNPASVKDVTMLSVANIDSVLLTVELDEKVDKLGVISPMSTASKITSLDPKPLINKLEFLGGVDNIIEQAITYLHASLGVRPLSQHSFLPHVGLCHGILLITGPSGCGKSSLVKAIGAKMSELPVLAYVNYVNCKNLRGSAPSLIKKNLENMFDEAAWYGPSVIIFDNLDTIVPAPAGPEAEMSLEMMYATKVAQILQKMIKLEIENCSRVMVLATSKSRSSLHPSLVSTQGIHYVQKTLHIGSPNKTTREEILQAIIRGHLGLSDMTSSTLDLSLLASKTEGYVARDLESLVKMAIHNKLGKYGDVPTDHLSLSFDDFEDALNTFKPVSVRHIQLHKPGQLGWADVGGLNHVKTDLVETLKWPSKYPELFNSCPLRMRSGILLYGAPGTGKTLLAGVVAKECGLNFISIKGPELLNKYIGASEQAVRELFTRAQNVKPCILFFDEFDSIAPKRGHDNTGVTDRVVNQLLTQLDGVEGLQGVYVLAATSRPDLIDPALLRPGRLDKSILCEMPDKEERTEILIALSRKMSLACDVDFDEIAAMCEHFTGADLKALLYNAQLKAIHEYTDDHTMKDVVRLRGNSHLCDSICRDDSKPKLVFPDSRSGSFSGDSPSYNYTPSTPKGKKNDSPRSRSGTHFNFNDVDKFVDNADEKSLKDVVKLRGNSFISDSMSQNDSEDEMDISETCITVSRSRIYSGDSLSHNDSNSTPKSKTNDFPKSNSVEQLILNDNVSDDINITVKYKAHESSTVTKDLTVKQVEVTSSTSDEKTNSETDKSSGDNQDNVVKFYLRGVKEKRKRHYARENKLIAAADKPSEDSQCLPLENPVTVFTSLERGLATLSPENKARYLAMVKEIQRRDEFLFQAANDKRRTSLQLASRPSALLEVNQRHLKESAKSMRPSVSPAEREKYSSIYQSFMSSKTKRFEKTQEHQVGLRATLA